MQKIKEIPLADLTLWTENPRDAVGANFTNQEIADRAISSDNRSKWSLSKLFAKMGTVYDTSELPTVVEKKGKFVVYDGNRRIIVGKIIHGLIHVENSPSFSGFSFPEVIPCNVCDENTALNNVLRKHSDTGSWGALERDIFRHKHLKHEKSSFLKFEEATGLISKNSFLNKRFIKEEVLTKDNLEKMGFFDDGDNLRTIHSADKTQKILQRTVDLIDEKKVTTRQNRLQFIEILKRDRATANILKHTHGAKHSFNKPLLQYITPTRRNKPRRLKLFGETLKLKSGIVNDLYVDLLELDELKQQDKYSDNFAEIIRMALRLIVERAADTQGQSVKKFLEGHFDDAKNLLSKDEKTTLSAHSVDKKGLAKLLQIGAHNYTETNNYRQTLAISLILGKILSLTNGEDINKP